MKTTTAVASVCIITAQAFIANFCKAQTTDLKPAPSNVSVDGNIKEWGDLAYTNDKAKISYTISNDKNNLYLVVKTKDHEKQSDILGSGITFSIDTKGRKRNSYAVTFPVSGMGEPTEFVDMDAQQLRSKIELSKFRKVKVEGFKGIDDKEINFSNLTNIKISIGYDEDGSLVYEEAIPLNLFNANDQLDKEWSYNIKINGLVKKMQVFRAIVQTPATSRSSNSGRPGSNIPSDGINLSNGDRMGSSRNIDNSPNSDIRTMQVTPSIDFWGKFNLAKVF
ncbi:MAG TPA: hypothetical protein VL490_06555 [Mucilaginibacter sp.]|jgi:hypothetical protein|nr:hypothetical protein [Mucilaginibacter sp.]